MYLQSCQQHFWLFVGSSSGDKLRSRLEDNNRHACQAQKKRISDDE